MSYIATAPRWISSPAEVGSFISAETAGNFTVGMDFYFLRQLTWVGVRFYVKTAGLSWKVRAYNATTTTSLGIATSTGPLPAGIQTVLFSTPIPITDIASVYLVSAYETSGTKFSGITGSLWPVLLTMVGVIGDVYLINNTCFTAGDAQPGTGGGSSARMAVEPVYTLP